MDNWSRILPPEANERADALLRQTAAARKEGHIIYPPQADVFRALALTPPEAVSVVCVGQDPYFRAGQANGLAFSVAPGVTVPPSLRNIFKELHSDIGCPIPSSGDLTPWAERGVLLLNTALTVEDGQPNSHSKWGWQEVVYEVLRACLGLPQPVVFMLWGGQARAFAAGLQVSTAANKACVYSSHPSPLGATKGNDVVPAFIGSRPFSSANRLLQNMGAAPVDWTL